VDDGNGLNKLLVRVALPPDGEFYAPTFHMDSAANQLRGVSGRVLGKVPKPSHDGLGRLRLVAQRWGRQLYKTVQADLDVMPNRYTGSKRKRYLEALDRLEMSGLTVRDAYCNAFVKAERFNGHEKEDPDPRMIQFRGAKYCVELASYLQPGEHQLYRSSFASRGVVRSRNIAKGLNQRQRAALLLEKLSRFDSPVVVSLDASRFDKHVDIELLRIEHSLYACFNNSPRFAWLLSLQLVNKVFTKLGMKYVAKGRRMSGDMNTALGNCVLMLLMVVAFCQQLSLERYDALDDGDDCLLIVEEADLHKVLDRVTDEFLEFGMEMKVECVARIPEEVVFCRSRPVNLGSSWVFVRDYRDIISKALSGIRHWQDAKYRARVIKAVGMCELSLNSGVPVLQEFSLALLRNTRDVEFDVKYLSDGLRARWCKEKHRRETPITEEARDSFCLAFGVDHARQLELERYFSQWVFNNDGLVHWGAEWTSSWQPEQSFVERTFWKNA